MPVRCDGVLVHPGDVVCAGGDGVIVIQPKHLLAAIEKAERRMGHEAVAASSIESGKSLFELHDLETAFAASGVREIEAHWDDNPTGKAAGS